MTNMGKKYNEIAKLVDKTYIISGPGEMVNAKLVRKNDIMVSNVINCVLKSLD